MSSLSNILEEHQFSVDWNHISILVTWGIFLVNQQCKRRYYPQLICYCLNLNESRLNIYIFIVECSIAFYQTNECLWNHSCTRYHQESNKDLLYDLLCKELEGKYDIKDIKKNWKELVKKFKNEHAKASVRPSGSGTSEIYKPSWVFYEHLKYLTVIYVVILMILSIQLTEGLQTPELRKYLNNNKGKLARKENQSYFQKLYQHMREPASTTCKGQNTLLENSEVAAFANYMRLTLSKFNPRKSVLGILGIFCFNQKKVMNWRLPMQLLLDLIHMSTYGRYSPAPSMPSSYGSNEGMPMTVLHENMHLHSYPNQSSEYY